MAASVTKQGVVARDARSVSSISAQLPKSNRRYLISVNCFENILIQACYIVVCVSAAGTPQRPSVRRVGPHQVTAAAQSCQVLIRSFAAVS
ncbi:hypothetical protein E2C01_029126 [Portunus trituberculatus]|uniref:Uncharacterized protein n=1 Tax=Portunus trituberculatus TaxID=210409 RepID=A0A5B7ER15_PORTR|nr:hypothetical protein [Portunus trituberculatus]